MTRLGMILVEPASLVMERKMLTEIEQGTVDWRSEAVLPQRFRFGNHSRDKDSPWGSEMSLSPLRGPTDFGLGHSLRA